MGDICDRNDCNRFMRSKRGKAHLDEIVAVLQGRTITNVSFSNEVQFIATTLHLDDDTTFFVAQPSLDVDALREQFAEVIEEEYYRDFPERKSKEKRP